MRCVGAHDMAVGPMLARTTWPLALCWRARHARRPYVGAHDMAVGPMLALCWRARHGRRPYVGAHDMAVGPMLARTTWPSALCWHARHGRRFPVPKINFHSCGGLLEFLAKMAWKMVIFRHGFEWGPLPIWVGSKWIRVLLCETCNSICYALKTDNG